MDTFKAPLPIESLGDYIKRLRVDLKMSQNDVARVAGIHIYSLLKIERGIVTAKELGFVNRRHVTIDKLNAALVDIINRYNILNLPGVWGEGKSAAADGTKYELYEENLLSEYHMRYGGYGGIAYHHVSDTYVALISQFISCGTSEAYIIEGLYKNLSDIQPDTIHADTHGQSTPVESISTYAGN